MSSVDFRKLLTKSLDDVKRPPALPPGTAFGTIMKHEFKESPWVNKDTGEKDPQVVFTIKVTHPGDDMDAEAFKEAGGNGKLESVAYTLDEGGMWKLKNFIEGLGISTAGKTLDSTIPETTGSQVMFVVTNRVDKKDPERVFADLRNVRAAA